MCSRIMASASMDWVSECGACDVEQVGDRLGLSKQRVRQIGQTALAKLRATDNDGSSE